MLALGKRETAQRVIYKFTFNGFKPDTSFQPEAYMEGLLRCVQKGWREREWGQFMGKFFRWCGHTPSPAFFENRLFRRETGKDLLKAALSECPEWLRQSPYRMLSLAHEHAESRTPADGPTVVSAPFPLQYALVPQEDLDKAATRLARLSFCRITMLFEMLPHLSRPSPTVLKLLQKKYGHHEIVNKLRPLCGQPDTPRNGDVQQLEHAGQAGGAADARQPATGLQPA